MTFAIKNQSISPITLTNYLFAFFPFSFLFGSSVVNINFFIFCCLGIYHLKSKIFTFKFNLVFKIIFLFFLTILISTGLSFFKSFYFNGYDHDSFSRFIKSVIFLRYFLFILIIYQLSQNNILNLKYFFYSAAFTVLFLSLDVIFQYVLGFNIIGLQSDWIYNSSFFGSEKIAGGYITRFSFFLIFLIFFFLKEKINTKFIITTVAICTLGTAIICSGNRMPFIIFILGLFFIFLFNAKIRKIVLVSILCLITIFTFIILQDKQLKKNYFVFYNYSNQILFGGGRIDENKEKKMEEVSEKELIVIESGHKGLYLTAIDTWNLNKVLGNGIKSFRIDCKKIIKTKKLYRLCSTHPHNYYLEILTETGIVGLLLIVSLILLVLFLIFKNLKITKQITQESFIYLAATTSLIMEMFPIRSTGSFFTTNNATYIIIVLAIFLCTAVKEKKN